MMSDHAQSPSSFGNTTRKVFATHRWLGRILMLYLLGVFASGTLLVFGSELESLFSPHMQRQSPSTSTDLPAGFGTLLDAALAVYPDAKPLIIRTPASGWFASQVEMRQNGRDFIVWIDPVNATVQGRTAVLGLKEILRRFHVSLLIDSRIILILASSVSIFLLAQIVLGLKSYRRFWRSLLRSPVSAQKGRMFWGNWHRWAGVWSTPLLMVTCLTGIFYFVESIGFTPNLPLALPPAERQDVLPRMFDGADLDQAVALAKGVLPGLLIREIYFPKVATEGLEIRGDLNAVLVRPRANMVTVDPETLALMGVHKGEELSFGRRLTEAADPLHFGTWGGAATQVVWVVSGLLALTLVLSGLMVASWRTSTTLGKPSLFSAIKAIFLPARWTLLVILAVCVFGALRLMI